MTLRATRDGDHEWMARFVWFGEIVDELDDDEPCKHAVLGRDRGRPRRSTEMPSTYRFDSACASRRASSERTSSPGSGQRAEATWAKRNTRPPAVATPSP